jgi:hypothetical protein
MILAFSGNKFVGKDTAAEIFIRKEGFKRIGLADKLKDICSEVFEIPREDMDNPSKKECIFKTEITITSGKVDSLLGRIARDGFKFDFETKFTDICKNFNGKNLTSIRDMLQTVGTDICRTFIKDDIWLEYVKKEIQLFPKVVITDARFKNEREYLKNIGAILILVKRPGYENKSQHISENQLGLEDEYDIIVNNDQTIQTLQSSMLLWYSFKNAT